MHFRKKSRRFLNIFTSTASPGPQVSIHLTVVIVYQVRRRDAECGKRLSTFSSPHQIWVCPGWTVTPDSLEGQRVHFRHNKHLHGKSVPSTLADRKLDIWNMPPSIWWEVGPPSTDQIVLFLRAKAVTLRDLPFLPSTFCLLRMVRQSKQNSWCSTNSPLSLAAIQLNCRQSFSWW